MKRTILGNRSDNCALTVFFCLMALMFMFTHAAQGQDQNQLLNWNEDGRNPDDFEVLSLLPSGEAAIEVDDGDGKTRTKTFIVPVTANATLTVVATPQPDTTEENLPDEWTLTGGTGTGKLSRTVSLADPGKFVLNGLVFDACAGSVIGTLTAQYLSNTIDRSTAAENANAGNSSNICSGFLNAIY